MSGTVGWRQTFSSTVDSPTFMVLSERSARKGHRACAGAAQTGGFSKAGMLGRVMGERGPFRRLLNYMKPHRGTVRLAAFCSVFNKFWDLAPPLLIGLAVDVVVLREESTLANVGLVNPWHQLVALSVLTFLIWGLESLFEYFYGVLWRNLAQTVQHELRLDTFDHVQQQGMTWFDERQKGDILAILNDDINQLERFLDKGANDLLQVSTTVVVVGAVFLLISWQVALFAVLPIPLIVWGSFRYQRSLEPRYAKVRQAAGQMNALLENDLSGMSTVNRSRLKQTSCEGWRHSATPTGKQTGRRFVSPLRSRLSSAWPSSWGSPRHSLWGLVHPRGHDGRGRILGAGVHDAASAVAAHKAW